MNRRWQCATIQCDFTLPERFDLTYVGADGDRHRPVMLHRVILGSLERFIGVLIEHYAGAFPVWLAPMQAILLPITDRVHAYAEEVAAALRAEGLRVEVDSRHGELGLQDPGGPGPEDSLYDRHRGPGGGRPHPVAPVAGRHRTEGHSRGGLCRPRSRRNPRFLPH